MFDKIILRAFGYLLRPVRVFSEAWLLCVVICSIHLYASNKGQVFNYCHVPLYGT